MGGLSMNGQAVTLAALRDDCCGRPDSYLWHARCAHAIDHVRGFVQHASEAGDDAWLTEVPDAGHFEIVTAGSSAWPTVEAVFRDVLVN